KKAMTRLGNNGSGVIVISKRNEGYFVSALENIGTITVNNEPLNDQSLKLNNNDILVIDNTSLQFFLT
ncbi:MAG: FHA domain-containing protein, partial [Methylobacter sp.]|nr:FHA domain-containing protein [Methylobacter sp.]